MGRWNSKVSALHAGGAALLTDRLPIARGGASDWVALSDVVTLGLVFSFSSKSTSFTAAKNNIYALTTTALTVTFPATPAAGDTFQLLAGTASIVAFTSARNGSNINSAAADITVNNFWLVTVTFVDSTIGWRVQWVPTLLGIFDISTAAAGQILFPSTANLSSDANTLDAYAEGTWTPVLKFGGATTGITYTTQQGNYTRVGRFVHAQLRIVLSNKGSATGSATITGLPFAAVNVDGVNSGYTVSLGAGVGVMGGILSSTTLTLENNKAGVSSALANTDFTNTSDFIITTVYFV